MALIDPSWSYWVGAFWASALGPLACDGMFARPFCKPGQLSIIWLIKPRFFFFLKKKIVIFTVANLITTRAFPEETQGLAGAVFNTIAQFGASMGIAGMALVNSATLKLHPRSSHPSPGHEEEFLMVGYWGVFWACTALMVAVCIVGGVGLRRVQE